MKYIRWAFWNCYYAVFRPKTLMEMLPTMERCRAPWWKWKPSVWHNDDGKMWHVTLSEEPYYVESRTIKVDVCVSQSTGDIVGLKLFDERLKAKQR